MRAAGIYDERRYSMNGAPYSDRSSSATASDSSPAQGGRIRKPVPYPGHGDERCMLPAAVPSGDDGGVVACLCGTRHDDGRAMIECERCQARTRSRVPHTLTRCRSWCGDVDVALTPGWCCMGGTAGTLEGTLGVCQCSPQHESSLSCCQQHCPTCVRPLYLAKGIAM